MSCLVFAAADVPTDYLFVAANATATPDDLREYQVRGSLAVTPATVGATLGATLIPPASNRTARGAVTPDGVFASELEASVRQSERRLLGGRSIAALAAGLPARVRSDKATSAALSTASAAPGDTISLRVGNAASSDLCANYTSVRAVVKAVGRYATIALDVNAPVGGFTAAEFATFAQEFDAVTFPTVSAWFGQPSDINGDGRITILFTPEINRLTPTGSLGFAGGFFFRGDLLPRSVPSQNYRCDASNQQEILYLLAPDPNGQINGNRFTVETARESARGTMAHEVQHMINQGIRQAASSGGALEVDWLNEGLSHFAEEVVGRAARGYGDSQRLNWTNVLADLDDFDSFFRQNLLRLRLWMDRPDLASPTSSRAAFELAPRGAAWALVRYAVDQYGSTNPRGFTRALVAGPQVDVANLTARTGAPFERLLPGFLVAMYGAGAVGPAYRYTSWDLREVMTSLNGGVHPLRLSSLPLDTTTRSLSGSGNFFFASRRARGEPATFRMLDPDGRAITFPGARVYVTRLR